MVRAHGHLLVARESLITEGLPEYMVSAKAPRDFDGAKHCIHSLILGF